jgi:hypothetical protein
MEITVRIPDDLAQRLGTIDEIARQALEALARAEFERGHLTAPELRRLLGADAAVGGDDHPADSAFDDARREQGRTAAANISARRKGVTLGGFAIKSLIDEGRP